MTPLAALSPADLALVAALIGDHPVFRVYLAAGLAAERRGARDRFALVGRERHGAALGVAFEAADVVTGIGRLAAEEETSLVASRRTELHLDAAAAERVASVFSDRVLHCKAMRYYRLDGRPDLPPDPRCRRLGRGDLDAARALFDTNYVETIFSDWMLDQPFFGLFESDELLACGGAVALADGIANIGNFLTRPDARGRGFAKAVAATLVHGLADAGANTVTLGTTDDNEPACRAYEAIGFRCFDRRAQLGLAAV